MTPGGGDLMLQQLAEADKMQIFSAFDTSTPDYHYIEAKNDADRALIVRQICEDEVRRLVRFIKRAPYISELNYDAQVVLAKGGWCGVSAVFSGECTDTPPTSRQKGKIEAAT